MEKLRQLSSLIGGAGTLLWLDTLCVPVSANNRKHRKYAIFRMRDFYVEASKVLVLDSCLQEVGRSIYERRLQVSSSEWMQRLWTLQEALLPEPENLLFQFRDGAIPLSGLITDPNLVKTSRPLGNENFLGGWSEIWHNLEIQTTEVLRKHFPKSATNENGLLVLVRTLQRRTTTKIEDEPICLANLTNITLEQFDTRPTLSMILRAIGTIPESLVFIPGPRMRSSGFHWAPQSFLQQRSSQLGQSKAATEEDSLLGSLTDRGFKIVKPSITLPQGFNVGEDIMSFAAFQIQTQENQGYKARASTFLDKSSPQLYLRHLSTAVVIFERRELHPGGLIHAILVSDIHEGEDVTYCHYEVALALSRLTKPIDGNATFVQGYYHGPRVWCID